MTLQSLFCEGKLINTGGLLILDKGFCYSTTETYPILSNSQSWSVSTPVNPLTLLYSDRITGLTESAVYYINAYATNSEGTGYSEPGETIRVTTGGISVYPTITVNILNNNINKLLFEIGTSNYLVVTGLTTKGDETVFVNGWLDQISNPQVRNPILQWNGEILRYNTSTPPPVSINFRPRSTEPLSWSITQNVYYNCGNPVYQISATTTANSVFPFLWALKDGYQSSEYFNPIVSNPKYFYTDSCKPLEDPRKIYNNKVIEEKSNKTFMVTPDSISNSYLILGYPTSYGNIQYSIDNSTWYTPHAHYDSTFVSTGAYGYLYGIETDWTCLYNILQYRFTSLLLEPRPFYIKFI